MLTKISVASLVRSEFYLVLDCDVFATRRTVFSDLVIGGRAVYAAKPFEYQRHRRTWWDAADSILQARGCVTNRTNARGGVIGVTPAILATKISREVMARVGALHAGPAWDESLFRLRLEQGFDWRAADQSNPALLQAVARTLIQTRLAPTPSRSEYTLYWTAACTSGLAERAHTPPHGVELYEENGFEYGAWTVWDAAKAFSDDSFVFTVIQSIGGAPPDWVADTLEPYLVLDNTTVSQSF